MFKRRRKPAPIFEDPAPVVPAVTLRGSATFPALGAGGSVVVGANVSALVRMPAPMGRATAFHYDSVASDNELLLLAS